MNSFFETSKKASKKRRRGLVLGTLRFLFNLALILIVVALTALVALYFLVIREYGERLDRTYPDLMQDSYVYDANGNKVGEFGVEESRETVSFEGFGKNLPRAVIAVEDRRFYDHLGVDPEGVVRAAWTDLRARDVQEGGSTITEQLMKNLFVPEDERFDVSFWRRFVQSALAFSYERHHTKKEILTAYLNTVYFGNGAYGAEMAAQRYFDKSAKDLTLSEAAALAGFLDAPSTYFSTGETTGSEHATQSRDTVLRLMEEQGMISASQMREAQSVPLEYAPAPSPEDPDFEPFMERVRREVVGRLGPEALGRGGLRIYTTLKPALQRAAVETSGEVLNEPDDPSAAVVSVEPQSGAIRALAGQDEGFNLPLDARRQPGSAFKPIVLVAALKEDISPESVYVSHELHFSFLNEYYVINNYDFVERGEISVRDAMAESDNTVFVQLAADVGLERVVRTARALGITSPVEPYPSTAIGGLGTGVSPLEMASAYATFAGGGIHRAPYAVERVERVSYGASESLYDHRLTGRRVMTGNQAAVANEVLRGVVEDGTATMFHNLDEEIGRPSAGKTGTTNNFADAWYVGYTPRLCTSVWVGYPEGRRSMVGVHGIEEPNGEVMPMDIWSAYMARATEGDPDLGFPEGDSSGMRFLYGGYYQPVF
ncbi:MAG TPA: transglycosylase domain-containing protein [Rubrobacteraceae bacterium]|nr:transglycosylase domain-containing protein [Rubrobacteraceae bacterium]